MYHWHFAMERETLPERFVWLNLYEQLGLISFSKPSLGRMVLMFSEFTEMQKRWLCKIHSWYLLRLRFWDPEGAILLGDLDQRQWLRSLKSWCIKQGNESSTRVDSSIPLIDKNLSVLGSLILILITPKECVLNFTNSEITPLTLVWVFVRTRNFRWF